MTIKFAITGVAGFVGGRLAHLLMREHGAQILGFCGQNRPTSSQLTACFQVVLDHDEKCRALDLRTNWADVMIHCAAKLPSHIGDHDVMRANIKMTLNALQLARRLGCRLFINISSSAVYGSPNPKGVDESHPLGAQDVYAQSKLVAEAYAAYCAQDGLKVVSLRIPSPQAPGNPHRSMVPIMLQKAKEQRRLKVTGDPRRRQAFLDLRDLCTAVSIISKTPGKLANAYNLATISSCSNLEMANAISAAQPVACELIDASTLGPTQPDIWNLKTGRAALDFGFIPKYSLNDMVQWLVKEN